MSEIEKILSIKREQFIEKDGWFDEDNFWCAMDAALEKYISVNINNECGGYYFDSDELEKIMYHLGIQEPDNPYRYARWIIDHSTSIVYQKIINLVSSALGFEEEIFKRVILCIESGRFKFNHIALDKLAQLALDFKIGNTEKYLK